jgi:excinuclease ABC subunit A
MKRPKTDTIKIRGARQHNLKNVSIDIPKNQLVVFTGVSGSGKSSLAFDTIYAEGQRRYVESLSAYARQFLGVMDKPDVDSIDGLSPSISIDQKTVTHNPRSTVGTITEVYDLMRLIFARVGHPHCPNDGTEIAKLSTDEILTKILDVMRDIVSSKKAGVQQFAILSPIVRAKRGEFRDLIGNIRSKGFVRARIDGEEIAITDDITLGKTQKHTIEVVIDSIPASLTDLTSDMFFANLRSRLASDIEQAVNLSAGSVILKTRDGEYLFSEKFSCPVCGLSLPEIEPRLFSFNSPIGACETCRGLGTIYSVDPERIINKQLSVTEGGIIPFSGVFWQDTWYGRLIATMAVDENFPLKTALGQLSREHLDLLLYGNGKEYDVPGTNRFGKDTVVHERFDGVVAELERRFRHTDSDLGGEVNKYLKEEECTACHGQKLKPEVLGITVCDRNIAQISELTIVTLLDFLKHNLAQSLNEYETTIAKPILKEIETRLRFLHNVGLSYLTISRLAKTLSGGELQRIRLASQIGTGLTGVLYVLDEPSIGLHPRDVSALISTLDNLKNLGNSLIVVEHDEETIAAADYLVELGPGAGKHGGRVTFTGTLSAMKKSQQSVTGPFLSGKRKIASNPHTLVTNRGLLQLIGAREHNLKNITMTIPLGNLVAVTGVSGSGKSTLIGDTLYPALYYHLTDTLPDHIGAFKELTGYSSIDRVFLVDQSPIGRTPRSNPATYVGFFDAIRDIFANTTEARARGFTKGRFSFNLKGGRCEKCQGGGLVTIEMQFLPDVYITCDVCEGRRYNRETLDITYKGKAIDEILKMTVDESAAFFKNHADIYSKLSTLQSVGLGYIELGQSATTFSGGEAQRIKLADELSRRNSGKTVYILDEPTTGLHFADIEKLLLALYRLVELGNTVIVIEHNLDVIKNCQYIVDLGPEGGAGGGDLVYQGPLPGILALSHSYTGTYLKKHLRL